MGAYNACSIIEPVCLEHGFIMEDKTASGGLGDLFSSIGVVQDDLGQNVVGSATDPAVDIVLDLTGEDIGIGPLRCQDQMDTE